MKILAAVAAPDETRTANTPLDVEREMHDAVGAVAGGGQVRILEVASLDEIARALGEDDYHVLHLSAHGSPGSIELEDEDGGAVEVTTEDLVNRLRDADVRVPLIVLSSCSGAADAPAMAASLVRAGADRGSGRRFRGTASAAQSFPGSVRDVGAGAVVGRADRPPPAAA